MKRQNIIRFSSSDFKALKEHLAAAGSDESLAYALCSKAKGLECNIYICSRLIIPDAKDLENQSGVSIEPSQRFQAIAYGLAYELGLVVVDIHTHPFSKKPHFSSIDDYHGIQNAKYITENFPGGSTIGMIVLGDGFNHFEARIWDRKVNCFEPVNHLEILGAPTEILTNQDNSVIKADDPYARHRIIPGWNQSTFENLKVFLCGLGGNGALIFESLLALGIGKNGWIMACDPDDLEASNLPRIPYAFPKDVGKSKATIAQAYARQKAPRLKVYCYKCSVEDDDIQGEVREANLIIGAVDKDGPRKILNSIAARYKIPYIDTGTEIIPEDSKYEAIGQVQVFVPEQTGCLMCSESIDTSEASLDMMSEEENEEYEKVGYVRGTNESPTPSILHLNGIISHLAISQMLKLIFNDDFKNTEYLHYNRQKPNLISASVMQDDECPVCGAQGYLGAGDENESVLEELSDLKDSKAFEEANV